ncbi:hypothetical protein BpHYR1_047169 [Brachionus plicatilis]|uniref:SEA domain-containing protein n=1 Tax=Brachionus plicatilis TaxID=10195 RepID=A0A3M7S1S8_BRAPC|nr:hypothetical protein BpHYR1_047169 [Brachionus plicatilis]
MNNQYVSYPPYFTYQSDPKKTSKFLKIFSHLPFLSSRASSETKGLIGFSVFVVFVLILAISGIIGLTFIGSFFRKVDQLRNSDFSIDVQDAFQIQNQQLSDILRVSESNRTKVQKDALEIEKIFIETKLADHLKSKLSNNFKNIYNIRLLPSKDNNFVNVSYTIKTFVIPKKTVKQLRNSLVKALSEKNVYKNLQISQESKIINDHLDQIISDAIEGEISGSLQSSPKNFSVLRDNGGKTFSIKTDKTNEDEIFPEFFVEKKTSIFPYDPYLDKVEYDRPFYDFNPSQPYFEQFKNQYEFSDENMSNKYLSNENVIDRPETNEELLLKNKLKKSSTQIVSSEIEVESEPETITKIATTTVTTAQKPNVVKLNVVTLSTKKSKTLDEILQDLVNETMLQNSNKSR